MTQDRSGQSGERKPWHEKKQSGKSNIPKLFWDPKWKKKADGWYVCEIANNGRTIIVTDIHVYFDEDDNVRSLAKR